MSIPDVFQPTFPGMEEAVSDVSRLESQRGLNELFKGMVNQFTILADEQLTGLLTSPESGERSVVIYDVVDGHEFIVLWGLNKTGTTRVQGTVYLNRDDWPVIDVAAHSNVKFAPGIRPTARKYDEYGDSIPLAKIKETTRSAVAPLIENTSGIDSANALVTLQEIKVDKIFYIPSSRD